jgi:acyl-homoserine lactone acylase PvdQ
MGRQRGESVSAGHIRAVAVAAALAALAASGEPAAAAPAPHGFQQNDAGGVRNILPPGQGQNVNAGEAAAFLGSDQQPAFSDDQLQMYEDLVYATPGLPDSQVDNFFKDASFGVRPGNVTRTYTPLCILPTAPQSDACEKVTIQRDQFGVPHITGETRLGAMFGAGYASAEDRLFFMDALRHAGRGQLSSFAGGANVEMDREVWHSTPYQESELQLQFDLGDDVYGPEGAQLQRDVMAYVDGINQYIAEIKSISLADMPVEYAALGQPQGPDPWKVTDVIATASLVAGIFGKGGGEEVGSALVLEEAKQHFGRKKGKRVWADFRSQNDPEADTTIHSQPFPYAIGPRKAKKTRGLALPDPGSTQDEPVVVAQSGNEAGPGGLGDLLEPFESMSAGSNALLVSGAESASGHPMAVFGPQVSYFSPEILMEQDIHAPATSEGPAIDARGAAFLGTNLYVQLGRGVDYAWSATSAGQDIIDTFALPLCEPDGSKPSLQSEHYVYRGGCYPFEVLQRENCWTPTFADETPAGCETLRSLRTPLGIVTHRAVVRGEPHVYTSLRVTYFHEVDSALGFSDFNNPDKVNSPQSFMEAACRIDYTFNWFYIDSQHIAYFNSGKNPVRAPKVNPNFPTSGDHPWQGFNPELNETDKLPCDQHPQVIDQQYLTSWNNKQAKQYSAADGNFGFGSVYRVEPLDERIQAAIAGPETMTPGELVSAMEDAGTVDLRGDSVLPLALKVIRKGGPVQSEQLRSAIETLSAWEQAGAHRRDADGDGVYEHSEAIRIMDAWWRPWVEAQFKPILGNQLFLAIEDQLPIDDGNRAAHMGSAFQSGWWGYISKDLRTLLSKKKGKKKGKGGGKAFASKKKGKKNKVRGRYSRIYCGGGKLRRCREALLVSLQQALATPVSELYPPVEGCTQGDNQWCYDAIEFRPVGLIEQPFIHWINRPTFQQVVEIFEHR